MKKILMITTTALIAVSAFARPYGHGPGPDNGPRSRPPMHRYDRGPAPRFDRGPRPKDSFWGRGGRNFWGGVVGGVVGAAIYNNVAPRITYPAPVYTTPVYTREVVVQPTTTVIVPNVKRVWVPGRYEYTTTADGTVVKVFVPGHYESYIEQ